MNCFPELTYSVYADGELPPEQARQVETHLAVCASCRAVVEGMRDENVLLSRVLAEAREELKTIPELQGASPSRLIFGMLAALAGSVLGLDRKSVV